MSRTISGLRTGFFDEIEVEEDFAIHGTLKTGGVATTGDVSCGGLTATGIIAGGSLDAGAGQIQTTGTVSATTLSGVNVGCTSLSCASVVVGQDLATITTDGAITAVSLDAESGQIQTTGDLSAITLHISKDKWRSRCVQG